MRAAHQGVAPTPLPGYGGGWLNSPFSPNPPAALLGDLTRPRCDRPWIRIGDLKNLLVREDRRPRRALCISEA